METVVSLTTSAEKSDPPGADVGAEGAAGSCSPATACFAGPAVAVLGRLSTLPGVLALGGSISAAPACVACQQHSSQGTARELYNSAALTGLVAADFGDSTIPVLDQGN